MIYKVEDNQTFFELAEGTQVFLGQTPITLLQRVAVKTDGVLPFAGVVDDISASGNATVNACLVAASAEEPKPTGAEPISVEKFAKTHTRTELEEIAKEIGLDGNTYTNKTELATVILNN